MALLEQIHYPQANNGGPNMLVVILAAAAVMTVVYLRYKCLEQVRQDSNAKTKPSDIKNADLI